MVVRAEGEQTPAKGQLSEKPPPKSDKADKKPEIGPKRGSQVCAWADRSLSHTHPILSMSAPLVANQQG